MITRQHIHRIRRGFTLIEVIVTLLLIGIVMPAIMHAITISTVAAGAAQHRNEAVELAKSELAVIVAGTQWQNTNKLSGDFSPDWPGYQWQAAVQPWSLDTSGMNIQEIDLTVSWTERGHPESLMLSTLAYLRGQGSTQ